MIVFPGTFDPITLGHVDLIERARALTEQLVVAVAEHVDQKQTRFLFEDRVSLVSHALAHLPWVSVQGFRGLLVDFLKQIGAKMILRGLRQATDLAYEMPMALGNQALYPDVDTCFLLTHPTLSHVSSSWVKTVHDLGISIEPWVPVVCAERLRAMNRGKQF